MKFKEEPNELKDFGKESLAGLEAGYTHQYPPFNSDFTLIL